MCECRPELGYVCDYHKEQRRRERAVTISQIECSTCREQARSAGANR